MPEDREKYKHYSPQVKERALALFKEHVLTSREIAQELNVDYNTLRLWARKANLKRTTPGNPITKSNHFFTRERNTKIISLYFHHFKTMEEIGLKFDISKQRVEQILKVGVKDTQAFINRARLEEQLNGIIDLEEAAEWAAQHKEEFNLDKTPNAEVLKAAAQDLRLASVKKGKVWLTSETELRVYLANYHPGRGGHRRIKKTIPSED